MNAALFDIVIPTIGRASLQQLLSGLARAEGPLPGCVMIVDDRVDPRPGLALRGLRPEFASRVCVLRSGGRGPAAARNVGWRACRARWIAFLDDDTLPAPDWPLCLERDLRELAEEVAGSQGRIAVPRPRRRRPTDEERKVIALESARWITADMAYRRSVLLELGGFDERFRRAFREDAELALRVLELGHALVQGERKTLHPIQWRPAWRSVTTQTGNADDVLLAALHGARWRERAGAPAGRLGRHAVVTAVGLAAGLALALGRPAAAALAALGWAGATAAWAVERIRPGPRWGAELLHMIWTSALIPPLAVLHHLRGRLRVALLRSRDELRWPTPLRPPARLRLVLFDRDGTLIDDVPALRDAAGVRPRCAARSALGRLREAGVQVAIVSNQPGLAQGREAPGELANVHAELEKQLGAFGGFFVCPHLDAERCDCRKPAPGLLVRALHTLGVPPYDCALVGDIGADIEAASALGIYAVLVPTPVTRQAEIERADAVAANLEAAVDRLLGSRA